MMKKKIFSIILVIAVIFNITVPANATSWGGRSPVALGVAFTSGYRTADRPTHSGWDFSGLGSRDVFAVKSGTVVYIYNSCTHTNRNATCCNGGSGFGGYGNAVVIRHSDGMHSMYAHLERNAIRVSMNQSVSKGTVLAAMGNTGMSTGVHLHLEIRATANDNNSHRNPASYINLSDFSSDVAPPLNQEGNLYQVTSDTGLNLRSEPSTANPRISVVPYNTIVTVTEISGNWGKTAHDGKTGWISLEWAEKVAVKYRVISDTGLNLRSGAGTEHSVLTVIPYNAEVSVVEISGNWGKTSYGNKVGWISLDWVKKV